MRIEHFTRRLSSSGAMTADERYEWISTLPAFKRPVGGE